MSKINTESENVKTANGKEVGSSDLLDYFMMDPVTRQEHIFHKQRKRAAFRLRFELAWIDTKHVWGIPLSMLILTPVVLFLEGLVFLGECLESCVHQFGVQYRKRK